jgi:hypothetical protein
MWVPGRGTASSWFVVGVSGVVGALVLGCAGPADEAAQPEPVSAPTEPAEAPEATPVPKAEQAYWVVVVATAKSTDEARKMVAHHRAVTPGGFDVRVYDTNKIPSLKPGLFLVSPVVLESRAAADRLVKQYEAVFPGTYAREVPESVLFPLGFPQFSPVACEGEPLPRVCVADGKWRALVDVANDRLPPNASGPGQFEGQEVRRAELSGVSVVRASLPGQTSVAVSIGKGKTLEVDLSPYIELGPGLMLLMEGKEPVFSPYRTEGWVDPAGYYGFQLNDIAGVESWGPDALGE